MMEKHPLLKQMLLFPVWMAFNSRRYSYCFGVVNGPLTIPGSGQSVIIPLTINLDLFEFFGNQVMIS